MFNLSFKACVSLYIFILEGLSIGESGMLKSPTMIVLLSISPYMAVSICLMYWCAPMLVRKSLQLLYLLLGLIPWSLCCLYLSLVIVFILKSILSGMRMATPAFFWFPFTWSIFSHPFTFSLYVSLVLKWVSCRQHMYGSCFCIHSASLCLLIGTFNPFTFKVVIDMYVPITIFLIVLGLLL